MEIDMRLIPILLRNNNKFSQDLNANKLKFLDDDILRDWEKIMAMRCKKCLRRRQLHLLESSSRTQPWLRSSIFSVPSLGVVHPSSAFSFIFSNLAFVVHPSLSSSSRTQPSSNPENPNLHHAAIYLTVATLRAQDCNQVRRCVSQLAILLAVLLAVLVVVLLASLCRGSTRLSLSRFCSPLSVAVLLASLSWFCLSCCSKVMKVSRLALLPANPDILEGVDDLIQLSYLNEPSVLYNLKSRYTQDLIYSKAGPVLIALNPFKDVQIYRSEYVEAYKQRCNDNPHVYAVADAAYNEMIRGEWDSLLVTFNFQVKHFRCPSEFPTSFASKFSICHAFCS
ncbi:hypothetical protein Ahy_B10g103428 isoform B [Arachis hypogaea]|uniref:Myosin motor domain-containing protein n=1 Tax=Arachis hypogaea TaxID=3818 RepID=A0A444X3H9_ARAHY|nr:hypothetical protein Ahy_B10g103428 isoform B [Arachis hypogaea]